MSGHERSRISPQRRSRSSMLKKRAPPVPIATVRSFSSASSIRLIGMELTSEEECRDTAQLRCQECQLVVRRGSNLILHLSLSAPLTSSYKITLTFIPARGLNERSSIFKASGQGRDVTELWLKISLPSNFPVGKYDAHISMSVQSSVEVLTHMLHSAVTVLFNPWHKDDDTYMEDPLDLQECLVSEVGVIWRGTVNSPIAHPWEYGQYREHCLDAALLLLRDLTAEQRRSAAVVSRTVVASVSPADNSGVLVASYDGRYGAGTHPCRWNGSAPILQRFFRTCSPVRFAHCWVQAGVAVSLMRALGIPCRPVTCYEAAAHSKQLGQVNCFFSPEGDILDELQTDQLWPYHVWCEAWMRRDDLPSGYDGWQALYCGCGSSAPCCGPAPLKAIKERKHGKLWQCEVTRFLSELHSEMRYHRVTHSYSSFSQRAVTLAHSQSKQTGQLLLTGRGIDCTNYTILTTSYKTEEEEEEGKDERLHCNGYPPPSQDCCFTVECDGGEMGKDCSLTITVTNRGAMLRTVDGRVVGGVCRHNGGIAMKFMGIHFSGVVTPEQTAVVKIPVLSRQFLKHLVEENMLKFFVVVKVWETRQLYLTVTHHHISPPPLIVTCPPAVRVGEGVKVKLSFTNPLPSSVSHSVFTVQAQGLCPHKEVAHRQLVLPGRCVSTEVVLRATAAGHYTVLASMHCDQLTDIRGWGTLDVTPS